MKTPRTSIFKKEVRRDQLHAVAVPPPEPPPWSPPNPANINDGLPRVIGVCYMEPNPLAPDDRSKDIQKFGFAVYSTNGDGAELIALKTLDQVVMWARQERATAYATAGEQVAAIKREIGASERTEG